MPFLPTSPNINTDSNSFTFKNWFQSVWRFMQGLANVGEVQTVAFTADPTVYFYACDTSGGAYAVTLPLAADCLGKRFTIAHTAGAAALTVALLGADTLAPTTASPIILNGSMTFISDGVSIWYAETANSSGGGSSSPLTTKGDLWTYSTVDARLPVGANNKIVVADSTAATGNKWDLTGRQSIVQTINSASGAYTIDMSTYNGVILNMVGPVTLTFSGGTDFQICRIRAVQDATGGRLLTFGAGCAFGSDITNFASNTTANKTDLVAVQYNETAGTYQVVAFTRGY